MTEKKEATQSRFVLETRKPTRIEKMQSKSSGKKRLPTFPVWIVDKVKNKKMRAYIWFGEDIHDPILAFDEVEYLGTEPEDELDEEDDELFTTLYYPTNEITVDIYDKLIKDYLNGEA